MQTLLDLHADPNIPCKKALALQLSLTFGRRDITELLLKGGARVANLPADSLPAEAYAMLRPVRIGRLR